MKIPEREFTYEQWVEFQDDQRIRIESIVREEREIQEERNTWDKRLIQTVRRNYHSRNRPADHEQLTQNQLNEIYRLSQEYQISDQRIEVWSEFFFRCQPCEMIKSEAEALLRKLKKEKIHFDPMTRLGVKCLVWPD